MRFLDKARRVLREIGPARRLMARQQEADARLVQYLDGLLDAAQTQNGRAMPKGNRRLVMGLSAYYGERDLAPFVLSLRRYSPDTDVVLFTHAASPQTRHFLDAHGVAQVPFDTLPLFAMSMNSARMFRYLEFLRGTIFNADGSTPYEYIMLSDVRDVIFQGDPFADLNGADLYYFLEGNRTFGNCPINARWMEQAFGPNALRDAKDAPVSCAGTLIAAPAALMLYLVQMCRYVLRAPPLTRNSGIDQAIHNHIMINRLIPSATVVKNGAAVMTVPTDTPHGMTVSPDGMLRNADGSISAVVHQYDRDPTLLAAINALYG